MPCPTAARLSCRHSPELAQAVIDSGALDSLVTCLEEFDPGVKEAATWCLGYIAGHNAELAQQVVDAGEGGHWQRWLCHGMVTGTVEGMPCKQCCRCLKYHSKKSRIASVQH